MPINVRIADATSTTVSEIPWYSTINEQSQPVWGGTFVDGFYKFDIPWTVNFDGRTTNTLYVSTKNKILNDPIEPQYLNTYKYRYLWFLPSGLDNDTDVYSEGFDYKVTGSSPNRVLNIKHESRVSEERTGFDFLEVQYPGLRSKSSMNEYLVNTTVDDLNEPPNRLQLPWPIRFGVDSGEYADSLEIPNFGAPFLVNFDDSNQSSPGLASGIEKGFLFASDFLNTRALSSIHWLEEGQPGYRTYIVKLVIYEVVNSVNYFIETDIYFYEDKQEEIKVVIGDFEEANPGSAAAGFYIDSVYKCPFAGILNGPDFSNKATLLTQDKVTNALLSWEGNFFENDPNELEIHITSLIFNDTSFSTIWDSRSNTQNSSPGGADFNSGIFYAQNKWFMQAEMKATNTSFWSSTDCINWESNYVGSTVQNQYGRKITYDDDRDEFIYIQDNQGSKDANYYANNFSVSVSNEDAIYQPSSFPGLDLHVSTDSIVWEYVFKMPFDERTDIVPAENTGALITFQVNEGLNARFDGLRSLSSVKKYFLSFNSSWAYRFWGLVKYTTYFDILDEQDDTKHGGGFPTQEASKEQYVVFSVYYDSSIPIFDGPNIVGFGRWNIIKHSEGFNFNTNLGYGGEGTDYFPPYGDLRLPRMPEGVLFPGDAIDVELGNSPLNQDKMILYNRYSPNYYVKDVYEVAYPKPLLDLDQTRNTIIASLEMWISLDGGNEFTKVSPNNLDTFSTTRNVLDENNLYPTGDPVPGGAMAASTDGIKFFEPIASRQYYYSADGTQEFETIPGFVHHWYAGDILLDATYGGGLWIVVGKQQHIETSTDGINWQVVRYYPFDYDFNSSIGQFTVIRPSYLNTVTYSDTDGIWICGGYKGHINVDNFRIFLPEFTTTGQNLPEPFIVDDNLLLNSTDTITWIPQVSPATGSSNDNIRSSAYGNGYYVVVGGTDEFFIMSATDSIHWEVRTSPTSNSLNHNYRKVKFENNQFFALGTLSKLMISTDSIHWTARTTGESNRNWDRLFYVNYQYAPYSTVTPTPSKVYVLTAVGGSNSYFKGPWLSTDTIVWENAIDVGTNITIPDQGGFDKGWDRISFNSSYGWFSFRQNSQSGLNAHTSTDMISWSLRTTTNLPEYDSIRGSSSVGKLIDDSNHVRRGLDDMHWGDDGNIFAFGYTTGVNATYYSADEGGIDNYILKAVEHTLPNHIGAVMSFANNFYFATNKQIYNDVFNLYTNNNLLSVSTDAIIWQIRTLPSGRYGGISFTYDSDNELYVGVSEGVPTLNINPKVIYSTNTIIWLTDSNFGPTLFNNSNEYFQGPTQIFYANQKLIGNGHEIYHDQNLDTFNGGINEAVDITDNNGTITVGTFNAGTVTVTRYNLGVSGTEGLQVGSIGYDITITTSTQYPKTDPPLVRLRYSVLDTATRASGATVADNSIAIATPTNAYPEQTTNKEFRIAFEMTNSQGPGEQATYVRSFQLQITSDPYGPFEYGNYSIREYYNDYPYDPNIYRHVFCGEFFKTSNIELDVPNQWTIRTAPIPKYVSHSTDQYNQEFIQDLIKGDGYWLAKMDVANPTRTHDWPIPFNPSFPSPYSNFGIYREPPHTTQLWYLRTLNYTTLTGYSWSLTWEVIPAESSGHIIASTDFIHWSLRTTAHGPDPNPTDRSAAYDITDATYTGELGTATIEDAYAAYHHIVEAKLGYGNGTYAILGSNYTPIINETIQYGEDAFLTSRLETSTDTIHWVMRTLGIPYSTIDPFNPATQSQAHQPLDLSFGYTRGGRGPSYDIHYGTVNGVSLWLVTAFSHAYSSPNYLNYPGEGNPHRVFASTDAIHWTARTTGIELTVVNPPSLESNQHIESDDNIWVIYAKGANGTWSMYSTDTIIWSPTPESLYLNVSDTDFREDVARIGYIGNNIWVKGNDGGWDDGETLQNVNDTLLAMQYRYPNGDDGVDSNQIKYGSYLDVINRTWNRVKVASPPENSPYYSIQSVVYDTDTLGNPLYGITSSLYKDDPYTNHLVLSTDLVHWEIRTMNAGLPLHTNGSAIPTGVHYLQSVEGSSGSWKSYGYCRMGALVELEIGITNVQAGANGGLYLQGTVQIDTPAVLQTGYLWNFDTPGSGWNQIENAYVYNNGTWIIPDVYVRTNDTWTLVQ